MNYQIIRSKRKTIGLEVRLRGLVVRAPLRSSDSEINLFVLQHRRWIEKHLQQMEERKKQLQFLEPLSRTDLSELADKALELIPERVRFYAPQIGVTYGRITIRNQKTRWGSCSKKGNLSFNCLLMLMPPEVIDSVVVHELCHRKEMNHSAKFYSEILRVFPDYWKWNRWLKENGTILMERSRIATTCSLEQE